MLLTPGNFAIGGGFQAGKTKYYNGTVPEEFVLVEDDLLVTMTDLSKQADTLGYPAFVPASQDGRRFLHNQRLGKISLREAESTDLTRYLYYVLCSREYRNEVLASATGTTVKHTSPERIKRYRFPLPPLPEQRRIAHVLGALDDKIELNRRMAKTLDAMARALFRSWFVDFEPVRAKLDGRWRPGHSLPGLPADHYPLFPDTLAPSPLGHIPDGWQVRGLDSIAAFLNGLALQKYPPTDESALPVIKIAQLRAGHTLGADWASGDLPQQYKVHDGDVLFSWSGSLELVVWAGGEGALNQHLFKVTSETYPQWLYYHWVREHLPYFQDVAAGKATTMGHIQRHHLTEALTVVPHQETLSAMDELMQPLSNLSLSLRLESRALAAQRDALLPKLVSGEVLIPPTRKQV